jgi:hypothetical protein
LSRRCAIRESRSLALPDSPDYPPASINRYALPIGITRIGSQPSGKGPADYFTGTVRIDPLFEAAN